MTTGPTSMRRGGYKDDGEVTKGPDVDSPPRL